MQNMYSLLRERRIYFKSSTYDERNDLNYNSYRFYDSTQFEWKIDDELYQFNQFDVFEFQLLFRKIFNQRTSNITRKNASIQWTIISTTIDQFFINQFVNFVSSISNVIQITISITIITNIIQITILITTITNVIQNTISITANSFVFTSTNLSWFKIDKFSHRSIHLLIIDEWKNDIVATMNRVFNKMIFQKHYFVYDLYDKKYEIEFEVDSQKIILSNNDFWNVLHFVCKIKKRENTFQVDFFFKNDVVQNWFNRKKATKYQLNIDKTWYYHYITIKNKKYSLWENEEALYWKYNDLTQKFIRTTFILSIKIQNDNNLSIYKLFTLSQRIFVKKFDWKNVDIQNDAFINNDPIDVVDFKFDSNDFQQNVDIQNDVIDEIIFIKIDIVQKTFFKFINDNNESNNRKRKKFNFEFVVSFDEFSSIKNDKICVISIFNIELTKIKYNDDSMKDIRFVDVATFFERRFFFKIFDKMHEQNQLFFKNAFFIDDLTIRFSNSIFFRSIFIRDRNRKKRIDFIFFSKSTIRESLNSNAFSYQLEISTFLINHVQSTIFDEREINIDALSKSNVSKSFLIIHFHINSNNQFEIIKKFYNYHRNKLKIDNDKIDFNSFINFFQSNIFEFEMIKAFYNYRKIKFKIDNDKIDFNFFMNFFQSNIFESIVFENTNDVFFVRKTFIFLRSIQNRLFSFIRKTFVFLQSIQNWLSSTKKNLQIKFHQKIKIRIFF